MKKIFVLLIGLFLFTLNSQATTDVKETNQFEKAVVDDVGTHLDTIVKVEVAVTLKTLKTVKSEQHYVFKDVKGISIHKALDVSQAKGDIINKENFTGMQFITSTTICRHTGHECLCSQYLNNKLTLSNYKAIKIKNASSIILKPPLS